VGRIFVAAGHVPGAGASGQGLEEGQVAVEVTARLVAQLKRRGASCVHVPDDLDLGPTIAYINSNWRTGDRALELHMNSATSISAHGCLIATSHTSQAWARKLVPALHRIGIDAWNKGVFDEAEIAHMRGWHHLGFPHQIADAALLEMGFISSPEDAAHFEGARLDELAGALADALAGTVPKPVDWPVLRLDDRGPAVLELKAALAGYFAAHPPRPAQFTMDGRYGAEAVKAVKAFQRRRKLKATGVVDAATWQALIAVEAERRLSSHPH
jgi:hypothetical protein